jgi:hypothetical protein
VIQLGDSVVLSFDLADFLSMSFIDYQENGVEVSASHSVFVKFSFKLSFPICDF